MLTSLLFCVSMAQPQDAPRSVTLPILKDQSIDLHEAELDLNLGARPAIRIKGNQHIAALQFDVRAIAGENVVSATLIAERGDHVLEDVTISTIQARWDELRSTARTPGTDAPGWGFEGARFPTVCDGLGNSLLCTARADETGGTYRWELDPDLVQALALGRAHGLAVHEHGSDLSRNPTILARETRGRGARLLVETGPRDGRPGVPKILRAFTLPREELAFLEVRAPAHGFAYDVELDGIRLEDHLVPFVQPSQVQWITLGPTRALAGSRHVVRVRVLNRNGEPSAARVHRFAFDPISAIDVPPRGELPAATRADDLLVVPVPDRADKKGHPIEFDASWLQRNAVWNGEAIHLRAARGEVVGFDVRKIEMPRRIDATLDGLRIDVRRALHVNTPRGSVPDPLVPLDDPRDVPAGPAWLSVDVYVPFEESRTQVTGRLVLDEHVIPIELEVRAFELPREVSFVCEMNTYGFPDHVATFDALQHLAYDHRTHVNVLPYPHRTAQAGSRQMNMDMRLRDGRRMDEQRLSHVTPGTTTTDWSDFVTAFGTYLDGTRFADGHRGAIQPPGFYLPFHESWPLHVRPYFSGNPDAFEAFREHSEYASTFTNLVRDFERLAREHGWLRAGFQIYCNAKGSLNDLARGPWTLDEPTTFWDYRALAYYGTLVHDALPKETPTHLRFRVDISRPQFDRQQLANDVAPLWVVSLHALREHRWLMRERRAMQGIETWAYGSSSEVHESARRIQALVLEAWLLGARGFVPWQTVDRTGRALTEGDRLATFVLANTPGNSTVQAYGTLRLRAYRRAQQDVEYLERLAARDGIESTRELVRAILNEEALEGIVRGSIAADPMTFHHLREVVAERIQRR